MSNKYLSTNTDDVIDPPMSVENGNETGPEHEDGHKDLGASPTPGQVVGRVQHQVGQGVDLGHAVGGEGPADVSGQSTSKEEDKGQQGLVDLDRDLG